MKDVKYSLKKDANNYILVAEYQTIKPSPNAKKDGLRTVSREIGYFSDINDVVCYAIKRGINWEEIADLKTEKDLIDRVKILVDEYFEIKGGR